MNDSSPTIPLLDLGLSVWDVFTWLTNGCYYKGCTGIDNQTQKCKIHFGKGKESDGKKKTVSPSSSSIENLNLCEKCLWGLVCQCNPPFRHYYLDVDQKSLQSTLSLVKSVNACCIPIVE
jgi:hypothetical protein